MVGENPGDKKLALKSALSSKVADNELILLEGLILEAPKTRDMAGILSNLKTPKALIVLDERDDNIILSARNIPGIKTTSVNTLNVYDILKYDKLIMTQETARKVEEVYAG